MTHSSVPNAPRLIQDHAACLGPAVAAVALVRWAPVFAGALIAALSFIVLSVLGMALTASYLSPYLLQCDPHLPLLWNPFIGAGTLSTLWSGLCVLLSLGAGAFVAGRYAVAAGWLHGLLVWAIWVTCWVSLMVVLTGRVTGLAGSAAGTQVSNEVMAVSGNAAASLGDGVLLALSAFPNVTEQLRDQARENGTDFILEDMPERAVRRTQEISEASAFSASEAAWATFLLLAAGIGVAAGTGRYGQLLYEQSRKKRVPM